METWLKEEFALSEPALWGLHIFAIVLATAMISSISRWVLRKVEVRTQATKNVWDDILFASIRRPVRFVIWVMGLSIALQVALEDNVTGLRDYIMPLRHLGFLIGVTWFGLRFIEGMEKRLFHRAEMGETSLDRTTILAIGKLLKISVMITTFLIGLQTLGFSVSGVLAAGGVGGLAMGFAAKDMLANFFGALMIYLDKPFKVGDWIRSPDKEIEGTVEDIGWRATSIRTFDQRPLYVPNSVFTTISVENPSRMRNRRIKEIIGVRYADMKQVQAIATDIREMLQQHKDIDKKQTLFVHLDSFGASSVDILIYCFTKTVEWIPYHGVKEKILLTIADIIEENGAEIAFPTRTLHVESSPEIKSETKPQK